MFMQTQKPRNPSGVHVQCKPKHMHPNHSTYSQVHFTPDDVTTIPDDVITYILWKPVPTCFTYLVITETTYACTG